MAKRRTAEIFVVSDGRGETCTQVLKAALVQFESQKHKLTLRSNVRSVDAVHTIIEEAAKRKALVFYTLVGEETRRTMSEQAARRLVPTVDVLGPTLSGLHDLFKREPAATPGLLYASERENYDRHEAIDYTLKHDDGRRPDELSDADAVLVGVSRACKSSTCFYLAYEGIKAANVPLIPGVPPPAPLVALDPERVIGLRINVLRLITVREVRASGIGLGLQSDYVDKRAVAREVNEANRMMEQHGWRSFDASYMAIEEIAKQVIRLRGLAS